MNILEKSKKTTLLIGAVLLSTLSFAQDAEASAPQYVDTPIYEQLGLSSTSLFTIMTIFTLFLLAVLSTMASTTNNVLKHKQDQVKKNQFPKIILALVGLFAATSSMAAETGASQEGFIPFPDSIFWGYVVVDVFLIMFIIYLSGVVKGSVADMVELKERKAFRWKRLSSNLTNSVSIEDEGSILLDHDYDGITELDNQLPPWWKYGFYITIVWAIGYFFYYQVFEIGNLQEAEFKAEMDEGDRQIAEYKAAHPELIDADNVELLTDQASISKGKSVFDKNCVLCHMDNGGGGIGANLTDEYWLYGNDIGGVFNTISEGAENGMASWKAILDASEIQTVSSYILQLKYVAPPTGKEPQGDKK